MSAQIFIHPNVARCCDLKFTAIKLPMEFPSAAHAELVIHLQSTAAIPSMDRVNCSPIVHVAICAISLKNIFYFSPVYMQQAGCSSIGLLDL
jgi:hypothetical protein